jgi:hypothetical protein
VERGSQLSTISYFAIVGVVISFYFVSSAFIETKRAKGEPVSLKPDKAQASGPQAQ